jgi:antitoxin (DNA-binding transcriptional repressor) of toxin-antitoxin stability system
METPMPGGEDGWARTTMIPLACNVLRRSLRCLVAMKNRRVSVSSVRSGLDRLMVWINAGRGFIVCRAGKPIAELVPARPSLRPRGRRTLRRRRKARSPVGIADYTTVRQARLTRGEGPFAMPETCHTRWGSQRVGGFELPRCSLLQ